MSGIAIGDIAKDIVTGFRGAVIAEYNTQFNVRRLALASQKLNKEGLPLESQWFDETILTLVKPDVVPSVPPVYNPFDYLDEVEDTITGFKGKVVGDIRYINGCVKLSLLPMEMKDGLPQDAVDFSVQRLTLVKKTESPVVPARTGGPMDVKFKSSAPSMKNRR
jgi:hypothetical protein